MRELFSQGAGSFKNADITRTRSEAKILIPYGPKVPVKSLGPIVEQSLMNRAGAISAVPVSGEHE